MQRSVVMMAAWLEIVAGAAFLTAPDLLCRLLFSVKPEGAGTLLARFAAVALLALGIACLPSTVTGSNRSAVFGLFVFNLGVAILFAMAGLATTFRGVLLWPALALHAVVASALLPQLLTFKTIGPSSNGKRGLALRNL